MSASLQPNFDLKENIREFWSQRAATFDHSASHKIESQFGKPEWQIHIRNAAGIESSSNMSGMHVLDLACGTGEISQILCSLGAQVTGIDFSDDMLAIARAKLSGQKWEPLLTDAEFLREIDDNSVDFIVTRHLAWTLTNPETAYSNWFRVLRPGGRILINDGNWRSTHSFSYKIKRAVANLLSQPAQRSDEEKAANEIIWRGLPYGDGLTKQQLISEVSWAGFEFSSELRVKRLYKHGMRAWPLADRLRQTSENRFAVVFEKPMGEV